MYTACFEKKNVIIYFVTKTFFNFEEKLLNKVSIPVCQPFLSIF